MNVLGLYIGLLLAFSTFAPKAHSSQYNRPILHPSFAGCIDCFNFVAPSVLGTTCVLDYVTRLDRVLRRACEASIKTSLRQRTRNDLERVYGLGNEAQYRDRIY